MNHGIFDCVIIGGGPAGLTCGIFLGRYRRKVLIFDSGKPRNYASHGVHGFLGQHGILPSELLARGREEALAVGVNIREAVVTKVERVGDLFEVSTSDGGAARARRIVLAYGVRDELPDIPELEQYYGTSIFHCPDCDGFEVSDRKVGVIGWGKAAVGLALKMRQWSDQITVFTHGHERNWTDEHFSKLLAGSIGVKDEKITALEGNDGKLRSAVLESGERVAVDAFFFTIGVKRTCTLAEDIGCEVDPEKPDIIVDEHRQTTVEGVYAAGDLVPGSQLVITSAADGAVAAIEINKSLLPPGQIV